MNYIVVRFMKDSDDQYLGYLVKNLSRGFLPQAWGRQESKALKFRTEDDAKKAITHIIKTPGFQYSILEID